MKIAILILVLITTAWAVDVVCPMHDAACNGTGQYKAANGNSYQKYHCICGDDVWVKQ